MNDALKAIGIIVGFSLILALSQWSLGNNGMALLCLGLIPFAFVCWGLSWLLAGSRRREIARHFTDAEREQFTRLARSYGRKCGLIFALPVFVLVAIFPARSPLAAVVVCAAATLVGLPFAFRVARPMRDFYGTTEYASQQPSPFD